jgi:hypothetical protein
MTIKLKDLLKESVLGEMPSDKLMKMKWNPVTEDDVFDDSEADTTEDPKANMAVKKFDMLLKGKPGWEKTKEIIPKLSDIKQAEFILYLITSAELSDTAKKKLKLKL